MNDLAFERDLSDAKLRRELDAAARRERATILKRFLAQSAEALLGQRRTEPVEPLCAACG
jgi:hypothetical protein